MLTGKKRKALEALLTHSTRRAAAQAAGHDDGPYVFVAAHTETSPLMCGCGL